MTHLEFDWQSLVCTFVEMLRTQAAPRSRRPSKRAGPTLETDGSTKRRRL